MRFLALIPARYASSRFPAKPLAMLGGKPIIQHVYERVSKAFTDVYVATDDERIAECVAAFGGHYIMTSTAHRSGTDRCYEAYLRAEELLHQEDPNATYDIIVNVQGDEPFIAQSQLHTIRECFANESTDIATLAKPFTPYDNIEHLFNPNSPKVVIGKDGNALYFSRSVIPYLRGIPEEEWLKQHTYHKHIGLYAYRARALREITTLQQGDLEKAESLEQLRWLENGYHIQVGLTEIETIGIDTPEDLQRAELFIKNLKS